LELPLAPALRRALIGWAEIEVPNWLQSPKSHALLVPASRDKLPIPPTINSAADKAFYALARFAAEADSDGGEVSGFEETGLEPDKDLFG
jgi:hypothetical protein